MLVGGPAIAHTGAAKYLSKIIEMGYVDVLFAGNALATHDIETALYGTSLGVSLNTGLTRKKATNTTSGPSTLSAITARFRRR